MHGVILVKKTYKKIYVAGLKPLPPENRPGLTTKPYVLDSWYNTENQIVEVLRVEWQNLTPRYSFSRFAKSPQWKCNQQPSCLQSCMLVHLRHDSLLASGSSDGTWFCRVYNFSKFTKNKILYFILYLIKYFIFSSRS